MTDGKSAYLLVRKHLPGRGEKQDDDTVRNLITLIIILSSILDTSNWYKYFAGMFTRERQDQSIKIEKWSSKAFHHEAGTFKRAQKLKKFAVKLEAKLQKKRQKLNLVNRTDEGFVENEPEDFKIKKAVYFQRKVKKLRLEKYMSTQKTLDKKVNKLCDPEKSTLVSNGDARVKNRWREYDIKICARCFDSGTEPSLCKI